MGAFYDDPLWAWAFPDPEARRDQHGQLWRLFVEGAARFPNSWFSADHNAVAIWVPPGGSELSETQEARFEPMMSELLDSEGVRRVAALAEAFDQAHPHDVDHYFLTLLGTDPAHRGKGIGLKLLSDTLAMVDADGMPAYLEASNPANVALYARYGFRPHSVFIAPADGPEVTTMWREARSG